MEQELLHENTIDQTLSLLGSCNIAALPSKFDRNIPNCATKETMQTKPEADMLPTDIPDTIETTATLNEGDIPVRLRRAITILNARCSRLAIVLDRAYGSLNQQATIRTAEAMGIQNIFIVDSSVPVKTQTNSKKLSDKITRGCYKWVTIRRFPTAEACVTALQADSWQVQTHPLTLLLPLTHVNDVTNA